MNEKVSIVIPTFRRSDKIGRALKSAIDQTYKNIEIIVVDDNAEFPEERQKTAAIVKKFPNVILIQNKENLGGAFSRNEGIKRATGELIAFLDDDDEYFKTKVEKQVACLHQHKNEKIGLIYCYQQIYGTDNKKLKVEKCDHEGTPLFEHMKRSLMPTSCWLCPKAVFEKVSYFERVKSQQDATMILRILGAGYKTYRVPEPLVKFYLHKNQEGISTYDENYINNIKVYHEKCYKYFSQLSPAQQKEVEYYFKNRLCNFYCLFNKKKAFSELTSMIRIKPLKLNNFKKLVKIIVS